MLVTIPADPCLEGDLLITPGSARAAVVCHPHPQYGGDMHNNVVRAIAAGLAQAGYTVLRFNFRGVGGSAGTYTGGAGEVDDAQAAIRYVRERTGLSAVVLAGYSFGAMVALQAGASIAEVERIIAVAPPLGLFDLGVVASCAVEKLFVVGDEDAYCGVTALQHALAQLTGMNRLQVVPGADHFFYGHEQAVAAAVNAFVSAGRSNQRS